MRININKKRFVILVVFVILLVFLSFYIERRYSSFHMPMLSDMNYAQANIMMAKRSIDDIKGRMAFDGTKPSSAQVFETQAIKLVKDRDFEGVAEKPIDPFTRLAEMAKTKKRSFVNLKESDLDKKIPPNASSVDNLKVMEYNSLSSSSNISPIYAPCDYMIFKTSSSWNSFSQTHKIRNEVNPDFSNENVIVIVSKSELPPGIFKIMGVSSDKDSLYIEYRVDVLEMADDNPNAKPNFYSATIVQKKFKNIKLKQIQ